MTAEDLDARRLELLRAAARERKLLGRPLQVLAYVVSELDFEEFRPVKSLVLGKLLQMARPHVVRAFAILVHSGLIEVGEVSMKVRTFRLGSAFRR